MKKTSLFLVILMIALTASVAIAAETKSFDVRLSNAIVASGNMCDAQTSVLKQVIAYIAGNCDCGATVIVTGYCNVKFSADKRAELVTGWLRKELPGKEYEITIAVGGDAKYGHVIVAVTCLPCPEAEKKTVAAPETEDEEIHGAGGLQPPDEAELETPERILPRGQARPAGYPAGYSDENGIYVRHDLLPANGAVYLAFGERGNKCAWCDRLVGNAWTKRYVTQGQRQKARDIKDVDRVSLGRYQMELLSAEGDSPAYWYWAWDDECHQAQPPRLRCNVVSYDIPGDAKGNKAFKARPKSVGGFEDWAPTENFVGQEGIRPDGQCLDIVTPWATSKSVAFSTW